MASHENGEIVTNEQVLETLNKQIASVEADPSVMPACILSLEEAKIVVSSLGDLKRAENHLALIDRTLNELAAPTQARWEQIMTRLSRRGRIRALFKGLRTTHGILLMATRILTMYNCKDTAHQLRLQKMYVIPNLPIRQEDLWSNV